MVLCALPDIKEGDKSEISIAMVQPNEASGLRRRSVMVCVTHRDWEEDVLIETAALFS